MNGGADVSPIDGRVIFEESPAPGKKTIYVTPTPYPDNRVVPISRVGTVGPRWALDGRSIYIVEIEGSQLVEVPLDYDGVPVPSSAIPSSGTAAQPAR